MSDENPSIIVVTNGQSTEYNYFADYSAKLPKGTVRIEPEFHNGNPTAVVNKAIRRAKKGQFDEVWAVFDKDKFPDFDSAVALAEDSPAQPGYSNPCFELWLLLHFQDVSSALDAKVCKVKLETHLQNISPGFKYTKSQDQKIHAMVTGHGDEQAACRRARQLEEAAASQPWRTNPTTAVYQLVEKIHEQLGDLQDK